MVLKILAWTLPHQQDSLRARLARLPDVEVITARDEDEAARAIGGVEALVIPHLHYTDRIEKAGLTSARLELIQLVSAGYDNLIGRRMPQGVAVASVGDALAPAVADHALALTLALLRGLWRAAADQAQARWDRQAYGDLRSLRGAEAVIIGFGPIGKAIAARLRACGARVTGVSRTGAADPAADAMAAIANLDDALPGADLVVIALPLNAETRGLIDRRRFDLFRRGALLINIARGAVVDTGALVDALRDGRLGGAGLDVTDPEPLPSEHALWRAPNCLITPHVGGLGGQGAVADAAASNIARLRDGLPLDNLLRLA